MSTMTTVTHLNTIGDLRLFTERTRGLDINTPLRIIDVIDGIPHPVEASVGAQRGSDKFEVIFSGKR